MHCKEIERVLAEAQQAQDYRTLEAQAEIVREAFMDFNHARGVEELDALVAMMRRMLDARSLPE